MKKQFVMRGRTDSGETEVLNFSGHTPGMAYRLTEFQLYGSASIGTTKSEQVATITAGKVAISPTDPDFRNEALIAVSMFADNESDAYGPTAYSVINDTFLITQNLILMVQDTGGTNDPVNWQCRFESVNISGPEEAVANYKQFMISDN